MTIVKCFIATVWAGLLFWLLDTKFASLPPLGKMLSPATGFWQNAEPKKTGGSEVIKTEGVISGIAIDYDRTGVPHIFSDNEHDLYFAQGYVTARDRLWQMEMETRTASGRLSEIFGEASLKSDLLHRRTGLLYSAQLAMDTVCKDPDTKKMLEAYSEGVNAYIKTLTPATYPLEYKLFDRQPMEWRPINALLILKLMGKLLTAGESEFLMANGIKKFGKDTLTDLMQPSTGNYPVIPTNTHWDFSPLPMPGVLENGNGGSKISPGHPKEDDNIIGSNSWVVNGTKTRSGYPILANDPHLQLSLPSIWYQLQMDGPGVNVCGVSVPGIPAVIIGYNEHISWGITNTKADVVDWYHIKFRDSTRQEYWYNDKWNKTSRHIEQFRCADGKLVIDTVLYTHQGPVVYDGLSHKNKVYAEKITPDEGFAMSWALHHISNDLKGYYLLNRAKDYQDYRRALTHISCPAQNITFACNDKDIALVCDGKFPYRYKDQGKFILNGSLTADDWHGWIPMNEVPAVHNPSDGYLCAANQVLTDSTYPYYIGSAYASDQRARRINERLSIMQDITVDSFRLLQMDDFSELAAEVLPALLLHLKESGIQIDARILEQLGNWDFHYSAHSIAATIFNTWWDDLHTTIWMNNTDDYSMQLPIPDFDRTAELVKKDTNSYWIDDVNTPARETLNDIVARSFTQAINSLSRKFGDMGQSWSWANSRSVMINYILPIPSFGMASNGSGGAPNTINALTSGFGPSWRMVVDMGPHVKGYGIMPGGESGNPGSFFYDNQLSTWRDGQLNELRFYTVRDAHDKDILSSIILKK